MMSSQAVKVQLVEAIQQVASWLRLHGYELPDDLAAEIGALKKRSLRRDTREPARAEKERLEKRIAALMLRRFRRQRDVVVARLGAQHPERKAVKGGPGSGNFGHEGRPGEVGGSGSGGGGVQVFHGTSKDVMANILREGIIPTENRNFSGSLYEEERSGKVFVASTPGGARRYAEMLAGKTNAYKAVVIVADIPVGIRLLDDEHQPGGSMLSEIRPEWITGYYEYDVIDKQTFSTGQVQVTLGNENFISIKSVEMIKTVYIPIVIETKSSERKMINLKAADDILINSDDWSDEEFDAELIDLLTQARLGGVALFGKTNPLQIDYTLTNMEAAAAARKYTYDLVKGIDDVSREALQKAITAFVETPGMTMGDIVEQLEGVYDENRALLIATTETTRAYASGQQDAGEALSREFPGVQVVKMWFTNNDTWYDGNTRRGVCEFCEELDGKEVNVDENFYEPEDEYQDGNPPRHVGCRCWEEVSTAIE